MRLRENWNATFDATMNPNRNTVKNTCPSKVSIAQGEGSEKYGVGRGASSYHGFERQWFNEAVDDFACEPTAVSDDARRV